MTVSRPTATERFLILDDPDELADHARPVAGHAGRLEAILAVDAVHCAACTQTIASAIDDEHTRIEVNVVSRRARLEWDASQRPLSEVLQRMADIGYEARPLPLDMVERADPRPRRRALWRMLVGVLCMMQVMMFSVPRYMGGDEIPPDLQTLMIWAEVMLTIPALVFAAGPFFSGAWRDLKQRRIGMDTPVALGIAVTVITSIIAFFQGKEVYFDSVTMIIGLLLIARWLESLAREKAAAGLGNSMARLPESANRLRADGSIERVSRRRLQPGDRISVPAGTTFAVDGLILEGSTEVDESLLTGEAEPQPRQAGMRVVSGSLNLRHPVVIEVSHRASDSRLAELNRLIERASTSRPAILRLADRYAGPFLVAVLIIAAVAGAVWWTIDPDRAPWIAAAILIVTCPCALALAAPSALLATLGGLARRGIIIDRSDTLEALARTDVVLFDKTGTLTTSTPDIRLTHTSAGLSEADAFALAAGIEHNSLHPVARAFAARAAELKVQPVAMQDSEQPTPDWPLPGDAAHQPGRLTTPATARPSSAGARPADTLSGHTWGEAGTVDEADNNVPAPPLNPRFESAVARIREVINLPSGGLQAQLSWQGHPYQATISPRHTQILLTLAPTDSTAGLPDWHASFALSESVRAGAEAVLAGLRAEGIDCRIVSGDHAHRVAQIGQSLGFAASRQQAQARPEDKLQTMQALQAAGHQVMMVGDGINDAPVLSQANVSVSLASAAPLAQHHADVLLLAERLDGLLTAHHAARRAMRIVHQNLIFSCLYNVVSIPLAAMGLVPPWLAGLGMAGSSLVVVLNALRAAR
ncbi:MAG: cation-translocating P-type ATPase [Lautropia sp.]|nr:cation-translocating P-type ATPase [Lautropia sp.]